jgi:hypothetical protein
VKTPGGQQAEEISKWAWGNPAFRVAHAISSVNALANSSQDPDELREIQDQGSYLYRLEGSVARQNQGLQQQPQASPLEWGSTAFGPDPNVKPKIRPANLIKVGPEGYIHGYICVRPPCGKEPGHIEPNELWMRKKDGAVIHTASGYRIGTFTKTTDEKGRTTFTVAGHEGGQVYQGSRKGEALTALSAHHNALTDTTGLNPESEPEPKPWLAAGLLTPADVKTIASYDSTTPNIVMSQRDGTKIGSYLASYKENKYGDLKQDYVATYADGTRVSKGSANPIQKILDYHNKQVSASLRREPSEPVPEKFTFPPDWSMIAADDSRTIDPSLRYHPAVVGEIFGEASKATGNQARYVPNLVARTKMQITGSVGDVKTRSGGNTLGLHYYDQKLIQLSPKVMAAVNGDAKKAVDYDNDSGWWSGADSHFSLADQVTAHEFGHGVAYMVSKELPPDKQQKLWLDVANGIGVAPPVIGRRYMDSSGKYTDPLSEWANRNKAAITKSVSKYGSTDSAELQAELWSEYTLKANPRPPAKAFGDFVMRNLPDRVVNPQDKLDSYDNPPPLSVIDNFDPTTLEIGETRTFPRIQVTRTADAPQYTGGGPRWELKVIHRDGSLGASQGAMSTESVRDTMRRYWNYDSGQ